MPNQRHHKYMAYLVRKLEGMILICAAASHSGVIKTRSWNMKQRVKIFSQKLSEAMNYKL